MKRSQVIQFTFFFVSVSHHTILDEYQFIFVEDPTLDPILGIVALRKLFREIFLKGVHEHIMPSTI